MKTNEGIIITNQDEKKQLFTEFKHFIEKNGYKSVNAFMQQNKLSTHNVYGVFRCNCFTKIDKVNALVELVDKSKQVVRLNGKWIIGKEY